MSPFLAPGLFCDRIDDTPGNEEDQTAKNNGRKLRSDLN